MHLKNIDLNMMQHLYALLEERNVSKAASRNHITQSAMSHALKKLREFFKDELLSRAGNEMFLTPKGKQLQIDLAKSLSSFQDLIYKNLTFSPHQDKIEINLGFHGYEESLIIPRLMTNLKDYPNIVISSISATNQKLPNDLIEGKIQLITTPFPPKSSGIKQIKLFEDFFVCISSQNNFSHLTMDSYLKSKHLLIAPYGDGKAMIDDLLSSMQLERHITIRINEFNSAPLILMQKPDLLCTVPKKLFDIWSQYYRLSWCPTPFPRMTFSIYMVWHSRWDNEPRAKWMRDTIKGII